MSALTTFILRTEPEGDAVEMAVAAICPTQFLERTLSLNVLADELRVVSADRPYLVDYAIAELAQRALPSWVKAAAISAHVPDGAGPSGGIVGRPHTAIQSATGEAEELGGGFSQLAMPGGPGVLLTGSPAVAETILAGVSPGASGPRTLRLVRQRLMLAGPRLAIAACDGTGPRQRGWVCALSGGRFRHAALRRQGQERGALAGACTESLDEPHRHRLPGAGDVLP